METIPKYVTDVLLRLEAAGFEAWLVGGCVRDLLRGASPADWDAASSARPEQVMALFGAAALPTGLRHGTVTVQTAGESVELTTFRREGVYSDGRHPDEVCFAASIREDLSRRDFTIGAMAMNAAGELQDPFGGRQDLARGILRCVGDPGKRFSEDALRIVRGLRFAAVLGLTVEAQTAAALHDCRRQLERIAPERVKAELEKLFCAPHMEGVLRDYPDVLGVWLPEILPMVGFDQHNRHHCYDVWEHTIHAMAAAQPLPVLRWALLLHDVGKPICFTLDVQGGSHFYGHPKASYHMALPVMERLRFSREQGEQVATLIRWHDRNIPQTAAQMRWYLHELGEESLRLLLAVKRADNLAQHPDYRGRQARIRSSEELLEEVLAAQDCFTLKQLAVKGEDLLALGLRGPAVGEGLQRLLLAVIDGEAPNEKAALLERIKQEAVVKLK